MAHARSLIAMATPRDGTDLVWIPTKVCDILLNPLESFDLVVQAEVAHGLLALGAERKESEL